MKKTLRCHFIDFWPGFNYKADLEFLFQEYIVEMDPIHPDYLFYSCFGEKHLQYEDCIKIFWSGENLLPDLNLCDYAVCLTNLRYYDRVFSYKLGLFSNKEYYNSSLNNEELVQRKFCNFVYGNNFCSDPFRLYFYNELSKYKKIDSAGSLMNNMNGFKVPENENKLSFLSKYKFTIAIENSSSPGYVTEKIIDPFLVQSVPIYWGNPTVCSDYNPNSFINLMDYSSIEEAIEEIIRLDKDDDAYLEKVTSPFWPYENSFEEFCNKEQADLMDFLRHIFDQPIEQAYRRTKFGNAKIYSDTKRSDKSSLKYHIKEIVKKVIKTRPKLLQIVLFQRSRKK